jgi:hypothetical protein
VLIGENHGLHPIAQAELGQHPGYVSLDRGLGDGQCRCYLRVGQAGGQQPENLDLPRGQLSEGLRRGGRVTGCGEVLD